MKKEDFKGIKYSPQTGLFYRHRVPGGRQSGFKNGIWGSICKTSGYVSGTANYKRYNLHRLAFLFMGVDIPEGMQVDHINGIRHDNRWINLRLLTQSLNIQNNTKARSGSKLLGAHWTKHMQKYKAQIWNRTKNLHLGYFKTELEAHTAYLNYMDDNNIPFLPEIDQRRK